MTVSIYSLLAVWLFFFNVEILFGGNSEMPFFPCDVITGSPIFSLKLYMAFRRFRVKSTLCLHYLT